MTVQQLQIDNLNSKATFSLKKLGFITVNGTLTNLEGQIKFDAEDLQNSSFDVTVQVKTISTGNVKRDDHLKNEDFFHTEKYPKINFKSSSIKNNNGIFLMSGQLSILETSKEVQIPFTFKNDTFSGEFSINRLDFNLGKKMPGFIIGKNIQIGIECKVK